MKILLSIVSLCILFLSSPAFSQDISEKYQEIQFDQISKYAEHKHAPEILKDGRIREKISVLLGKDFDSFLNNLENWSVPVVLKNKGVFFDGWKVNADNSINARSAFLIYADGRIYAAISANGTDDVKYYTNDNIPGRVHPAFIAWSRHFSKNPKFYSFDDNLISFETSTSENSFVKHSAILADSLTEEQQEKLRNVSNEIWGASVTAQWEMNAGLGDVVSNATSQILTCSKAYSVVPKPAGFIPGWSYIVKSSIPIVKYFIGLKSSTQFQYRSCINAAAVNYRTAAELAAAGI
ncbi:MAG: hypothetical protein V4754_19980 [Pseudomonadota bacterium]